MNRFIKQCFRLMFIVLLVFLIIFNFYVNVLHASEKINVSLRNVSSNHTNQHSTISDLLKNYSAVERRLPVQSSVWPKGNHGFDDRIVSQLHFIPQSLFHKDSRQQHAMKTILLYNGYADWGVKSGRHTFLSQQCPVDTCSITADRQQAPNVDAVLFRQNLAKPSFQRPPQQVWILYFLESPYFTPSLKMYRNQFNWTASYRRDSDIVAPYEKFVMNRSATFQPVRNYAAGKTKKVAWFVSNCAATNSRMEYAKELSRYISVDIFGRCGDKKCSRGKNACSEMLNKDYKFYLAFENSNCRDYITEKFYFTGLQHDVIPIVMGAAPEDYRRVSPHHSFIHVDEFTSPRALTEYLHVLDINDHLYNQYFSWKGTGEFINTYFWCRVCALLHDDTRAASSYGDIEAWWRGKDVCIGRHSWREHQERGTA